MKIAILSCEPKCYSTKRLKEAAIKRGHVCKVLNTMRFTIGVESQSPELHYRNKRLSTYEAVIPRIGASITYFGTAVLRQFEQMGVYSANESLAVARSRDKLRAIQILSRYDIAIPPTQFVRNKRDVMPAIERIGGAPVIIKVLEGAQGVGVILADSERIAEAIVETLHGANQNVLLQKFVKESSGRDIRAIVVGDRVVAAMRRRASGDEFRSNVHRGGSTELVRLDAAYERSAIRAAQIMGLRIAGVDMLEADDGPQVMEINSSPGLEGIEATTKIDVAAAIIQDIEQRVLFPDVDLKQRLRIAGGYVIAEFPVRNLPALEGIALRFTDLNARNIHVIHITRQNKVIPNPAGNEVIQTGDVLLCYGDAHELSSLMPKEKEKPKKSGSKSKKKS